MAETLHVGEVRAFSVFTGERAVASGNPYRPSIHESAESDPHRIGCWRVEVSAAGLALQCAEVPAGQEQRGEVSWAELHDMLGVRLALADDLQQLRDEVGRVKAGLVQLRVENRRLKTLVEARKARLRAPTPAMEGAHVR